MLASLLEDEVLARAAASPVRRDPWAELRLYAQFLS